MRALRRLSALSVLIVSIGIASVASAAASSEQELAANYAPIVALKRQPAACASKGEPYRPVPVDVVLGRADVRLVDARANVITTAPTGADLFRADADSYLDFPGSPLRPGCGYEQWAKRISAGKPTTSYAHVVAESGKVALQYWLYFPFNDFNNKHESDWEMIQLMFDAPTVSDALRTTPTEVGYSQHEGAERAAWDDAKLQKRGLHPIVYPGAGSHANHYTQALWLGHSAQEGFGCDDTRGPSHLEQTQAVLVPSSPPTSANVPFAWLAYGGHWGQKAGGPNTGPTGPNTKGQWSDPVEWVDDEWRDGSTAVPLQKSLSSATGFFCGAVAAGSKVYLDFLRTPWFVLGVLAAVVLLGIWLSRRTRWSPALAAPADQLRTGGQIYRSAWQIHRRYLPLFIGIGLIFIPLSAVAAIVQQLVFSFTGIGTLISESDSDPVVEGVIALGLGQVSTIIASVLVIAAAAVVLAEVDAGGHPDAVRAYKGVLRHLGPLAWAWIRIVVITGLLTITIVGIPVAIVYLVRKALVTQVCVLEDRGASSSLERSSQLVHGNGVRVFAITALVTVTAYLAGPIVGVLVLFLTSSSLALINVISSLVYVVVMPYVGVALALLLYDLRHRLSEQPALTPTGVVAPTTSR